MADRPEPRAIPLSASGDLAPRSATAASSSPAKCCEHEVGACKVCREIGVRVISSDELLGGARELLIVHAGQVYRLLRTRNDKLILQK